MKTWISNHIFLAIGVTLFLALITWLFGERLYSWITGKEIEEIDEQNEFAG